MEIGKFEIIVIGGSSGSLPVLINIVNALPDDFDIPIIIIIHRLKNVKSDLKNLLSSKRKTFEPEDKEPVRNGCIYLAPQNYHLLVEDNRTFSLDYSEPVNFSRPSIDVTFMSVADAYGSSTAGILLSGANRDGAEGINEIILRNGCGIVQDPTTADYPAMPESAIQLNNKVKVLSPENIVHTILAQHQNTNT